VSKRFRVIGWPVRYSTPASERGVIVEVDDYVDEAGAVVQAVIEHGDCALGGAEFKTIDNQRVSEFKVWVQEED
tara:strand:- start:366 stop:587 length:222 start_codon:yes stop_codon:yes gene_type:complete